MNLFTKSLSLFYWISLSFCAASEGNTTIGNTELDFLNNDDLRFLKLTKDEIKEAFCINDVYGKDHCRYVSEFLKTFLERQKIKSLSLWFLKNIILAIGKKENVSVDFLERNVTASLTENKNSESNSDYALSLIYSFIFQFSPPRFGDIDLGFVKINLKVPALQNNLKTSESGGGETSLQEVLLAGKFSGVTSITLIFEVIDNLKKIMKEVDENLQKSSSDDKLPIRNVGNSNPLSKEELDQISDIFKKTILSKKFSITEKSD